MLLKKIELMIIYKAAEFLIHLLILCYEEYI